MTIKLTKNGLRTEQDRLKQLNRYLPTLKLKKAMLQAEVNLARAVVEGLKQGLGDAMSAAQEYAPLLTAKISVNPADACTILQVKKHIENIAGIEVPVFEGVDFQDLEYSLLDTPAWLDGVIVKLRSLATQCAEIAVAKEKLALIEEELRQVSIRVNLFEKVLLPRAEKNIRKIKVFLGDQQLADVGKLKVVKAKLSR